FAGVQSLQTVRELSEHVIPRYTPFATLEEYLAGYTLRGDRLAEIRVPTTILTAADDPIVSIAGFRALPRTPALSVEIQPRGGHAGSILARTLRSGLEARIATILAGKLDATTGSDAPRHVTAAPAARREGLHAKAGHAFLASFLGWTLDAFDFFVLVFVLP